MAGGKSISRHDGGRSASGRYGGGEPGGSGQYDLNKDEDGGGTGDSDVAHLYKARSRNSLTVSREKYITKSYDKMRDRDDILRDLYASYKDGGVSSNNLIVQVLLDIRDILKGEG